MLRRGKMSLYIWQLYIFFSSWFLLTVAGNGQCPCSFAPKEEDSFSGHSGTMKTMCIVKASEQSDLSGSVWFGIMKELFEDPGSLLYTGIRIEMVQSYQEGMNNHSAGVICDSYLEIISDDRLDKLQRKAMRQRHYLSCPGTCLVVPHVEIPSSIVDSWIEVGNYEDWPSSKQNLVRWV